LDWRGFKGKGGWGKAYKQFIHSAISRHKDDIKEIDKLISIVRKEFNGA
jgi:hypothetical protein